MDGFALTVRFTIKDGHEQAFDQLVADTIADIRRHEAGTLVYVSHHVVDAPNQRIFYELYRDRDAFEAHGREPHVQRFLTERGQHLDSSVVDHLMPATGKISDASGHPR